MWKWDRQRIAELQSQANYTLNTASTRLGQVHAVFMAILVLIVCVTFVIQTYPLDPTTAYRVYLVDQAISCVFLVDYLMRWWARRFSLAYLFSPFAIIDLISILPLFISDSHWQIVRVLRLFRILRILRVLRTQVTFWHGILTPLHLRFAQIFFTMFAMIFISAGIIFDLESKLDQSKFHSFFEAIYFTIVTLTTVGFGDIVPISTAGRAVTLMMILTGITILPWQVGMLVKTIFTERNRGHRVCNTCGLEYHDLDARHCKHCGDRLRAEDQTVTNISSRFLGSGSRAPEE